MYYDRRTRSAGGWIDSSEPFIDPCVKGMCAVPQGIVPGSVWIDSREPFIDPCVKVNRRRFVDSAEQENQEDKKRDDPESLTPSFGVVLPAMTNRVGRICNQRDMHSRSCGIVTGSVFVIMMLVVAALGLRAVVSPANLWSCVAMPGPPEQNESWQITQADVASGSYTAAAQQGVASSNQSSYENGLRCGGEVFPAKTKEQFLINTKKRHRHEGAPLDGAYCVDVAPVADARLYDFNIMKRMITILRH